MGRLLFLYAVDVDNLLLPFYKKDNTQFPHTQVKSPNNGYELNVLFYSEMASVSSDLNPIKDLERAETSSLEKALFKPKTAGTGCSRKMDQTICVQVQKSH